MSRLLEYLTEFKTFLLFNTINVFIIFLVITLVVLPIIWFIIGRISKTNTVDVFDNLEIPNLLSKNNELVRNNDDLIYENDSLKTVIENLKNEVKYFKHSNIPVDTKKIYLENEKLKTENSNLQLALRFGNQYNTYEDMLQSSEWRLFRHFVFNNKGLRCEKCLKQNVVLNIHHKNYYINKYNEKFKPWDYPLSEVLVLCETCHKLEHISNPPKWIRK